MRTSYRMLIVPLVALALGAGCDDGSCDGGDRTYENGAHWTCADGCNGCVCSDGTVSSTAVSCEGPPGPGAGKLECWTGTGWQRHGSSWPCSSGCDECSCADGVILRAQRECGAAGEPG